MWTYISRRIIQSLIVAFILSFVCYGLMSLMPGDPVDLLASSIPNITTQDIDRLRHLYGLDKPITERYLNWLKDIAVGDFGYSRVYRIPVTDILGSHLKNTLYLSGLAELLSVLIGITIGVIAGLKPGSRFDYMANLISFAGISIPAFCLGLFLIIIFAVGLQWLPAGGTNSLDLVNPSHWDSFVDRLKYLILPVMSLTALQMATFVRYSRSSMMEAMRNDFIRTARAKGLRRMAVVRDHGFRNALIPIITIVALSLSGLFSGAIITETVFAYQGLGKLVYDSIIGNDFNVAMVAFMLTIIMVLLMNLVADILYGIVDPRISYR